jgi:hypothetical protein
MDNLDMKRARLRLELQAAHGAWLQIADARAKPTRPHTVVEPSGSPKETQTEWLEYLAAKERLVLAYAEQPAQLS